MTIGFDGSRAFLEDRTGTENYSYQLLKNISQIDTENRYLIYIRGNTKYEIRNTNKWPDNFEFKVINMPRFWTQVGLAFRTFIDPLDVLFVPSHTLPLIRKPGLKTVITVHDLGAEYLPSFHQLKQILYLNLMTHYQLKTATKIISVSEATKEDIVNKIGIEQSKIETVYEGVDKSIFKQRSKDIVNNILKNYDIHRGKYFLFVGTIQPRKNLERLVRAFAEFLKWEVRSRESDVRSLDLLKSQKIEKIKNSKNPTSTSRISNLPTPNSKFKLVLVGAKGWKSEDIYKLPKELGIEDHVLFLGRVSDQELVGLYNGAGALTYPSLFEGFGLPIVEAFACGCPVITSTVSSMPEVAGDAAILVNPQDQAQITEAMTRITQDDILRYRLIKNGIVRSEKFDWKTAAKNTIEIIKRTVS